MQNQVFASATGRISSCYNYTKMAASGVTSYSGLVESIPQSIKSVGRNTHLAAAWELVRLFFFFFSSLSSLFFHHTIHFSRRIHLRCFTFASCRQVSMTASCCFEPTILGKKRTRRTSPWNNYSTVL